MRIVHLVSYYNTRMKYQEYYLAKEQSTQGHEVYIITSERNYPFRYYNSTARLFLGDRFLTTGLTIEEDISILRLPVLFEFRSRVLLKGAYKTLKQIHADVVIIHGIVNFSAANLLLKKVICRYIFDDHMLFNQIDKSWIGKVIYWFFRLLFSRRLLQKASKIVAISEGCIPTINKIYGIPYSRIELIPLGANTALFKFDETRRFETRAKLGIDKNDIVLVYTGKIMKSKAPHLIAQALKLIDTDKKTFLLLVGNIAPEYENFLLEKLNDSLIPYRIQPHCDTYELVNMFCASDIAVYPVQATISTIEASACSLPVICTSEIPERYKSGNGFGIEPGNLEQLSSALEKLINNDFLRKEMGMKGRLYVEQHLSWKIISDKFLRF